MSDQKKKKITKANSEKTTSLFSLGVSDEQSPCVRVYEEEFKKKKRQTVKQRYDQTSFQIPNKTKKNFVNKITISTEKKSLNWNHTST